MKRENKIFFLSAVAVWMTCNIMFVSGNLMGCAHEEIVFEETQSDVTATASREAGSQAEPAYEGKSVNSVSGAEITTESSDSTEMTDSNVSPLSTGSNDSTAQENTGCYVDVSGAVVNPGVYEVTEGARVYEVLTLAGGMTSEAETECINQAIAVYDGLKLIVPTKEEWASGKYAVNDKEFVVRREEMKQSGSQSNGAASEENDGLVNINTASVEELCTLPGVGAAKAESIIAHREEYGPFKSIEDIKNVAGIKEGLFEKIKTKIKCGLE